METTKLKTIDYEFEGQVYRLSCNMNVLADVQDEYDGNLLRALNTVHGLKSTLAFLAAMLADAADTQGITDENGLPLHFTSKQLGRKLTMHQTLEAGTRIYPLIQAAVTPPEEELGEKRRKTKKLTPPGKPKQLGFDFPGFLAIWLFRLHLPERDFWKTMSPRRITLLLDALAPQKQPEQQEQPQSLSAYLNGGT